MSARLDWIGATASIGAAALQKLALALRFEARELAVTFDLVRSVADLEVAVREPSGHVWRATWALSRATVENVVSANALADALAEEFASELRRNGLKS